MAFPLAAIPIIGGIIDKVIDGVIPDKNEAARLKNEASKIVQTESLAELNAAAKIIVAEASGESWLQRSWRPLTMLTFVALIVAWWLGFTPERATPELMDRLFVIIQIGLGGYVVGRSAEKVAKAWKATP